MDSELSDEEVDILNSSTDGIVKKMSNLQTTSQRRRSQRVTRIPTKYQIDCFDRSTEIKTKRIENRKKGIKSSSSENELSVSEENDSSEEEIEKPSEVLFENEDVAGKDMFGFQTKKKRHSMAQKVLEAVNSPRKPLNLNNSKKEIPKASGTPSKVASRHSLRQTMKNKVAELDQDSTFEDFSESGSEYNATDSKTSESESTSNEEETSNSGSDEENIKISSSPHKKLKNATTTSLRDNKNGNYIMQSDDYFASQSSSKIFTSNHTLQKLKNPKLSEDQLQELLMSTNLNQSTEHEQKIQEMFKYSCRFFNKWMLLLHEGFNVLLYGLGSKRKILEAFYREMLESSPTVVVNGYFPSLTVKDVTDSILSEIFDIQSCPSNVYEAVELIEKKCKRDRNIHYYMIIHNIDGSMLRNTKSQNVLSSLADIPNMHLLASVDHINAPLIWDQQKTSKFNFTWWDATSFLPYRDETSFESSMLVQRSGALALSSLGNVYHSLTANSKGVFMLIVKYQLKNKSVKYYQGMPFKVLYSQCRENYLVSSDLTLRTQLTEFLDHKLVKSKRAADGVEQLLIPINNSLLQKFVDEHQA